MFKTETKMIMRITGYESCHTKEGRPWKETEEEKVLCEYRNGWRSSVISQPT
jgi:hypothetical protein